MLSPINYMFEDYCGEMGRKGRGIGGLADTQKAGQRYGTMS